MVARETKATNLPAPEREGFSDWPFPASLLSAALARTVVFACRSRTKTLWPLIELSRLEASELNAITRPSSPTQGEEESPSACKPPEFTLTLEISFPAGTVPPAPDPQEGRKEPTIPARGIRKAATFRKAGPFDTMSSREVISCCREGIFLNYIIYDLAGVSR